MKQDESEAMEKQKLPPIVVGKTMDAQEVTLMPLSEEAKWVQRAILGDPGAFEKLCKNYAGPVYRYFFCKVRSIVAARGLTLETFHVAQESISGGRWCGSFFGVWLFLIADSVFHKWLREKMPSIPLSTSAKFEEPTDKYTSTSDGFPVKDEEDALWRLVRNLSLGQQHLLALRYMHHLSFAEIALRLGCSENDCKQLHDQTLKDLKDKASLFGLWSENRKE